MKKILILSNSPLHRDPRIQRQIRSLEAEYALVACGRSDPNHSDTQFIPIGDAVNTLLHQLTHFPLLLSGTPERYYWAQPWVETTIDRLSAVDFDLVVANDYDCLPLAIRIAYGKPVIFDAHEYAPGQHLHSFPPAKWLLRRYRLRLCKIFIPRCDAMMTVAPRIAKRYRQDTGVSAEVVMNCPPSQEIQISPMESNRVRLIHHGGAMRGRRLELLVDMMDLLDDRFCLTLMLAGSGPYLEELRARSVGHPRITFRDPVPLSEIVQAISGYDIGVHLLPPTCRNDCWALPNKFFEFIQARLGVAIGPSPEMAAIVKEHDIGCVADEFTVVSLAQALNRLTVDDIRRFKENSDRIAHKYSSDKSEQQIREMVKTVLSRSEADS